MTDQGRKLVADFKLTPLVEKVFSCFFSNSQQKKMPHTIFLGPTLNISSLTVHKLEQYLQNGNEKKV